MRTRLQRWTFAAKPDSWPKLLVPFVLGQAIGLGSGRPSLMAFALGALFTILDVLYIVFLNDYCDREVDAIKRRMFPTQSSEKTIADGILPAYHLLFAGLAAGLGAIIVAATAAVLLGRPWLVGAALWALIVFAGYTLPPLRLNYRGGGELLEMIGVGLVLPWLNAYLQGGAIWATGMLLLPGFALLSLASAIASGLSDERSDRAGGKRTVVTLLGNTIARRLTEALVWMGGMAWLATIAFGLPWWLAIGGAASVATYAVVMHRESSAAITDAFVPQRRYKSALHKAIWNGASSAAFLLAYFHLWLGRR